VSPLITGEKEAHKEVNQMRLGAMVKKWWLGLAVAGLAGVMVGAACGGSSELEGRKTVTHTVAVAGATDDGIISIGADGVPYGVYMGTLYGGVTAVGTMTIDYSACGAVLYNAQLQTRALYRFNISEWTEGDVTFTTECLAVMSATAGNLEVYVLQQDCGALPAGETTAADQSTVWNGGQLLTTLTPAAGEISAQIPAATVTACRSAEGYIAIMVKATGETVPAASMFAPNAFTLSTYEYATTAGTDIPHVEWTA
jgi:hypothetical protein